MNLEKRKYGILDLVRLPIRCAPLYTILIVLFKLLDGIVPSIQVIAIAKFIDTSISVVSTDGNVRRVIPSMLLVAVLVAYGWLSETLVKIVDVKLEIKLREKFRVATVTKRSRLSYKYIENSKTWDLISRVCKDTEIKIKDGYINFLSFISLIIKVAGILIILIAQIWWVAVVTMVISIPLFRLSMKGGKASYESERAFWKNQRTYEYLGEVLLGREAVEERTLFRFSEEVNKKWWEQYEIFRKVTMRTSAKWFVRMKMGSIVTSFISIFIIVVLINPVISGTITVGMFISLVNAIVSLVHMMSWQLSNLVTELTVNKEYLKDLSDFIILEETEDAITLPLENIAPFKTLEFKNVRFKYPESENYILDGMSFVIEYGKYYAFVGANGAGKTTVTKLITGLYDEYEGYILIDGKNIKEYSQSYLKSMCSVVYQDFAKYFISFKDNISLGRVNGLKNGTNDELIESAITTMELSDVIEKLPNGMDSYLGKIKEGGVDLSGGQWQRVAMARTIISPAPLRILDEPTAALDPISESNIYEEFEKISRGGTTIFISHRLGSTKLADEIFVLGEGKVLEKGCHNELMNQNGIYANMYESQKGWYI